LDTRGFVYGTLIRGIRDRDQLAMGANLIFVSFFSSPIVDGMAPPFFERSFTIPQVLYDPRPIDDIGKNGSAFLSCR
jgi:hypothetical protein